MDYSNENIKCLKSTEQKKKRNKTSNKYNILNIKT